MANANAKSKPAGINDKVDIDVMSMVQIVEKENKKECTGKNSSNKFCKSNWNFKYRFRLRCNYKSI